MADLEDKSVTGVDLDSCKLELEEQYLIRDCIIRQQAIISWLQEGDKNTKFFHQALQRRRSRNNIRKILVLNSTISDPDGIKKAFYQHFKAQFAKRRLERLFSINRVLNPVVSKEDNELLVKNLSEEEIEFALNQNS